MINGDEFLSLQGRETKEIFLKKLKEKKNKSKKEIGLLQQALDKLYQVLY